jgi:hypothetical protein
MSKYLEYNNILSPLNHGFRQGLSCETQLITALNDWATSLNNKRQVDLITLDFSKAFDKVPHQRLLLKLSYYGIRNQTLRWISAFLSNRTQKVQVNGSHSSEAAVTSGVPQGTVLGPALFLLYINDISSTINSNMRLFADDSIIYRDINSPDDHAILQDDLEKLLSWANKWQMDFNSSKCTVMSITNKKTTSQFNYNMNNITLQRVSHQDYLGVTISHNLQWESHINRITKSASSNLGLLRRTLHSCSKETKSVAYKTMIRPKLEYASAAWAPHLTKDINRIESIQRQSARFVFGDYRRNASPTQMIASLGWDTLHNRRQLNQTVMLYKIINNIVKITMPPSVSHFSSVSRHANEFQLRATQSFIDIHKYSFYPSATRLWNTLPQNTVSSTTIETFKSNTIQYLRQNSK